MNRNNLIVLILAVVLAVAEAAQGNGRGACKCPRKKKICENGEKPVFRKCRPPCTDGSKPRCPAKRCSRPTSTTEMITTGNDIIENINDFTTDNPLKLETHHDFVTELINTVEPFVTEKHIDDLSNDEVNTFKNRKCKCPRRRKICENGDKPEFRQSCPFCADGSKPRCPATRCSKPTTILNEISTQTDIIETINDLTTEALNDDFTTGNPNTNDFLVIHLSNDTALLDASVTQSPDPLGTVSTPDFSTEKHVDPFPELVTLSTEEDRVFSPLFELKLQANVSTIPQCLQEGIVACRAVKLDRELLESLTLGRIVMLVEGTTDFTMELTNSPSGSKLSSVAYSFLLSTGGSGTMTVRNNEDPHKEPSVFASINTHGKWMYFVESCGEDCTIIYQRDSNFFNNFEDK
eukprot:GFUD01005959.1.p1 GENE.GFUD01005959.1~~GFUD01005959.1.p1  ORF type:complete len:421 (+),score=92.82 GFUD01005959.1:48-1265(+)